MEFLKSLGETVNSAVDFVVEKNKKFTKITKIKRQIKKESNNIIKSYIKLGKHYYNELRDVPNYDMQNLCSSIDSSKSQIKKLQEKLVEVSNQGNLSNYNEFLKDEIEEPIEVEISFEPETVDSISEEDFNSEETEDSEEPEETEESEESEEDEDTQDED